MKDHLKILGVLHIVMGALGALTAVVFLVVFGGIASMVGLSAAAGGDPDAAIAAPIVGGVGAAIAFFILLVSVPGILLGWGLLKFKPWARILGMVISALQLFAVPVGTALGIYGLWVLLNNETELLFRNPVQLQ